VAEGRTDIDEVVSGCGTTQINFETSKLTVIRY